MGMTNLTPAMKQYLKIKECYKDCILFFRMGDFYEMFFEDAMVASKILEITLTSRNKGKEDSIPLCGVPYHAASSYISKLIEKGFKVAICEQVEDPKQAKGVVKREVVRIVTPGLVFDDANLTAKENNFLAALCLMHDTVGLAFLDISTGEFRVAESEDHDLFLAQTSGLNFRELIIADELKDSRFLKTFLQQCYLCRVNYFTADYFDPKEAKSRLGRYFPHEQIQPLEIERHPAMVAAAGAALRYAEETQKDHIGHIRDIEWYKTDGFLALDDVAKRNLELFYTIADGRKEGSLFHALDETMTSMGGRRLKWWLNYPLIIPERIRERLAAVSQIKEHHLAREALRKALAGVHDLERLGGRIALGVANGRDLIALKSSIKILPSIRSLIEGMDAPFVASLYAGIDEMGDMADLIERSIADDPPMTIREGGIIKEGYDEELDKLISVTTDGRRWIAQLERKERIKTGINSLKVGFNSVFGYYLEVSKSNAHLVPDEYIRKQTLVNAERYINEELKKYEHTVLHAEELRREKEYEIFISIRSRVAKEIRRIQNTASCLADMDAAASLSEIAEKYNYCCPTISDDYTIAIKDGRHPVVERMPLSDGFVPNDVLVDVEKNRFLVITGPNMAGKSTFIRQIALIVILAQMGSFVPASEAHIGVVDRIFTRIGAADSLARGQSTFMVEMTEVAGILQNGTRRSLIILDEVGRGTSTFDGLSIAWAVAEYIHDAPQLGGRTLFATHYHQLTDLAATKEGVKNYNIAVKEWGDRIIFLRRIVEGGTNRSYGIQVAKIAGVPEEVISRAKEILANLEKGELDAIGVPRIAYSKKKEERGKAQLSLFMDGEELVVHELRNINLMKMTPIDAINMISEWKRRLDKE